MRDAEREMEPPDPHSLGRISWDAGYWAAKRGDERRCEYVGSLARKFWYGGYDFYVTMEGVPTDPESKESNDVRM